MDEMSRKDWQQISDSLQERGVTVKVLTMADALAMLESSPPAPREEFRGGLFSRFRADHTVKEDG